MAIISEIGSSQTALCGYIYVEDFSTYGTVSPDTRSDFGVALYVSVDPGSGTFTDNPNYANLSNPGAVGIPSSWEIDIPNSATQDYEINAYWAPLWISGSYNENDIIFYDAIFYQKSSIGTGTEEPGTGTEWVVLTEDDSAAFEIAIGLAVPIVVKNTVYEAVIACPSYKVIFKACPHVHRIIDNSETANSKRFKVTYYDGTSVIATTAIVGSYSDITLPEDHIYILTIEEEVITGTWLEVAVLPIYEFCSLKTCTMYLVNTLLCNNADPCCENCSTEAIEKQKRQRLQLNQLTFLYGTLLAYIHEESIEYLGIIAMDADRLTYMESIDNLFDKIKAILERCELCAGAWQTITSANVSSGSYKPCNC
jgi:ferredoxin